MSFVKLDSQILTSTLWFDRDARDVFLTALLMSVPHVVDAPLATLKIGKLQPDDFIVPPGWYGFCPAAGPGIVYNAGLKSEAGDAALQRLADPDPDSRSEAFGGRRMVRVDGGFIILNFDRFRWRDHSAAERMRRHRLRQRGDPDGSGRPESSVTVLRDAVTRNVTQAEAEAEGKKTTPCAPSALGVFDLFWKSYPRKDGRKAAIRAWAKLSVEDGQAAVAGLERAKKSEQWQRGVIPHASTWLNGERWKDEGHALGPCRFCTQPAVKLVKGIPVCNTPRHIDNAIGR